jgi:biopolymer transport protein ExbD
MKLTRSVRLNPFLIFIVPLVDVAFLLLLLFVASSTFLLHPGISVNLPFSKFTLGPQRDPVIVSVTAGPFPSVYYRYQKVSIEELGKRLGVDPIPEKSVIIRADRMAPQGAVVEVMNLCLERGYSVVLATAPRNQ